MDIKIIIPTVYDKFALSRPAEIEIEESEENLVLRVGVETVAITKEDMNRAMKILVRA